MNKKVIGIIIVVVLVVIVFIGIKFTGNGSVKENNIEGNLEDLMDKLYVNIPEEELPTLSKNYVTLDNIEYYLGTSDIKYTEAIASEPIMSSVAHSVVLVRLSDDENVEKAKEKIKNNVDPKKWICVGVDEQNVKVESKGNIVVLIMDNEISDKILDNFNNL